MDFDDYLLVVGIFLVIIITLVTLLFPRVSISPEYIDGVLTASSILFGFWFIMLERKPKNERFFGRVRYNILFSLGLLILTVMLLYLTVISNDFGYLSELTLAVATLSFIANISAIIRTIHYLE